MAAIRPLLFLAGLTFRRQLASRKSVLCLAFLGLLAVLVFFIGRAFPWRAEAFGQWVVVRLFGGFFVPIVAVAFGAGAVGDDRDEGSLVHLLVRALPRTGIYTAKLLAVIPIGVAFSLGSLAVLGGMAARCAPLEVFALFGPGILLSTLAYLSLFHLFAALFRHATVIGICYVFFIEVFLGQVPGLLNRLSINSYAISMAYGNARRHGLFAGAKDLERYFAIDPPTAAGVLAGMAAGFLILGAWIFSRREYGDGHRS